MATSRTNSTLRQIRSLLSLGRVGDRADAELLEWFGTHHAEAEAAFEELVVRHGPMVLDVCRRVLRDPNDVEDAFQATFLILVRRAGTIRNRDALGGWLHRVALRVALRAKSEAANRHEIEQRAVAREIADPTGGSIERADMRTALHEELDRIPATYRVALVACYLEGLTHEEAANRLRWPVGTVRSRLARGRDRLRDRLARRGFAPDIVLPALVTRPELVPAGLQKLATQSMSSYVAGHSLAGKVPAPVVALSERVIRAMNLRMLRIVAAVALTVGAIVGTLPLLTMSVLRYAIAAQQPPPAKPAPKPAAAAEKPIAKELQPFQGTWHFDACESVLWYTDLKVIRKTWRWEIHGQEITWTRQGKEPVKLSFTVALNKSPNPDAPNKSPNQIDLTFLDGPDKGKTCQGIYYFEKANLWICMTEPGAKADRPRRMAMSSDSKTAILILRRPNPAEPAPAKTSAKEQVPYREKHDFAGIVRDVSDQPIGHSPQRFQELIEAVEKEFDALAKNGEG